ncbi:MAG: fused MFS/spermidine synthase [Verrucomicrobiota bacterium]|jgi:spermidine synthase
MAGKRLLPDFGGAAYVWCGVVLFFQLLVVAAYYGSRRLGQAPRQREILLGLGLSGLLTLLPQPIRASWLPLELQPLAALLPFAGLATALFCATPLLHQTQADRGDFSIYAWSNAGALAGLICYPLLVEPFTDLSTQNWVWVAGGLFVCVFGLREARLGPVSPAASAGIGKTRWQWWVLPAVSSATMLATTNQISYEAAAGPLAWAMPLALFLATYVWAFSGNRQDSLGLLAAAGLAALTASHMVTEARSPLLLGFALLAGGTSMLACHVWLAASRNVNTHGFYSASAIGGALGSALMVLVIPRVTNGPVEFPILTLSVLTIAGFLWSGRVVRPILTTCAVVAIGGTLAAESSGRANEVARARTLYGCWRVTRKPDTQFYSLINNTTTHSEEDRRNPSAGMSYYGKETGLGRLILQRQQSTNALKSGVVGLGAGTLNRYLRPQDSIIYYELDPKVEQLARAWFTYLDNPRSRVVLGDGRKSLEQESQKFDLIILDAFNGDAIPMHLLTREAGEIYRRRLNAGGALAIHITNAHVDLRPVATGLARSMSTGCEFSIAGRVRWAILRPGGPAPSGAARLWTDQRSSLLGLFKQREQ